MNDTSVKVTADHLRRGAYLYVRQSSLYQVANSTESRRRQYDLKGRAVALGWPAEQVVVIDADQGQVGASAADRAGFQALVADVSLGKAGIVLGLECSRLARNNADWQRLLELCGLTSTLICDEDGLYDPTTINDRLLLGIKGTISEAELHLIRARLQGGILAKARRGELAVGLPIGFVYDPTGAVVLDPDAGVRDALSHLFDVFETTGSALAVVKAFAAEGLRFPGRHLTGPHAGELYWVPLRHQHVLFTLHNPRYAGAYFYGRHRAFRDIEGRHRIINKAREDWTVFIPGAHPGYISPEAFDANRARLAANAAARGEDRRAGPAREGPALLQGLVVCGRCGRRMTVGYHRRCDASLVPDYACQTEAIATGKQPCLGVCGSGIDSAVAELVLAELSPLLSRLPFRLPPSSPTAPRMPTASGHRPWSGPATRPTLPAVAIWPSTLPTGWWPTLSKQTGTTSWGACWGPGCLRPGEGPRQRSAERGPAGKDPGARHRPARPVGRPGHSDARAQAPHPLARHRRHLGQGRRTHHRPDPLERRGDTHGRGGPSASGMGGAHHPAVHSRSHR